MPTSASRLLRALIVIAIPIILVVISVRLLVTDEYLIYEYGKPDFPPDPFGFDDGERLLYASRNFAYVRTGGPITMLSDDSHDGSPLYNARELKHMQDVQAVWLGTRTAGWLATVVGAVAALGLGWRPETRRALADALRLGGLTAIGFVVVIGGLAVVAWNFWFVAFHKIFFEGNSWLFEYSDTLIRLFPEKFWFDAALAISFFMLAGGAIFTAIGWLAMPRAVRGAATSPGAHQPI
ncbi:MAG: DUF1461 domain-containing protein [Chloroflexi bacterium]|nr:DUF1461 domain-containing protein [Chloroflexota bacterium]